MSKYQALIDALKAGPDNWTADKYGNLRNDSNESVRLNGVSLPCGRVTADDPSHKNTAYMLAANPATIRSILADLERAEKALKDARPYLDEALAIHDITYDHHPATKAERCVIVEDLAAIDAALSQLKGEQGGGEG